jgi:hypothetical protein
MNRNMLQLNFTIFEPALENFDATELLGLNNEQNDKDLVRREKKRVSSLRRIICGLI